MQLMPKSLMPSTVCSAPQLGVGGGEGGRGSVCWHFLPLVVLRQTVPLSQTSLKQHCWPSLPASLDYFTGLSLLFTQVIEHICIIYHMTLRKSQTRVS